MVVLASATRQAAEGLFWVSQGVRGKRWSMLL